MTGLVAQLLLYGLAAAFAAPIAAVVCALILAKSRSPLPSAFTFVAGALLIDAIVVVVFFLLVANAVGTGDLGAYIDLALGILFLGLGLFAVFEKESPEKDAAQQARIEGIASGRLPQLIVAGIAVQIINFDAIAVMAGGLKEIAIAGLGTTEVVLGVAFLLLVMLLPYWLPAAAYAVGPTRTKPALARMTEWIMANSRMLEIVVGFGFGAVFAFKGVTALMG